MATLNKDKYLQILKTEGVNAALTALHHDKELIEYQTFESPEGYDRELWEELADYREFSRELWEISLQQGNPAHSDPNTISET